MATQRNTPVRTWLDALPSERARLVRLCARLTGSYEAAEDLAQETLYEAWRQSGSLRDTDAWRAFVTGIARNICLRWLRQRGKEGVRRAYHSEHQPGDALAAVVETEAAADPMDIEHMLERQEIASLLDKAMDLLPESARSLLTERYVDEFPQAEMAARRDMTENALGVRIHRAKSALQRILATPSFREDAASYGLLSPDSIEGWQETRLWCPRCGKRRLLGRFRTEESGELAPDVGDSPSFAVRCPHCEGALGYDFTSGHRGLPTQRVLGSVRGYKPALNRLSTWWHDYFETGLRTGRAACPICGQTANMTSAPPIGTHPGIAGLHGAFISCTRCNRVACLTASGIAYHTSAAQRFWRDHPRMALTDEREMRIGGHDAVAVTFTSLTDSAALEVILSRTNFETVRASTIHRSGP
jgi:RNA polymerase sigma-70 factor (ECF subfamily)